MGEFCNFRWIGQEARGPNMRVKHTCRKDKGHEGLHICVACGVIYLRLRSKDEQAEREQHQPRCDERGVDGDRLDLHSNDEGDAEDDDGDEEEDVGEVELAGPDPIVGG